MIGHYKLQNVVAWITMVIGMGLQSMLRADSAVVIWIVFQIIPGIGFGILVMMNHQLLIVSVS